MQNDSGRVERHTPEHAQRAIDRRLEADVSHYALHPDRIDSRLRELDEEWDVERVLETNASSLSLAGLGLALLGWRRMVLLPLLVQGFLLQHAVQGWCPPLPLLRRLGVRTRREIDRERFALMRIRSAHAREPEQDGDPRSLARAALEAAR